MILYTLIGAGIPAGTNSEQKKTGFTRNGTRFYILNKGLIESLRLKHNNEDIYIGSYYFLESSFNSAFTGPFYLDYDIPTQDFKGFEVVEKYYQKLEEAKEEVLRTITYFFKDLELSNLHLKLFFTGCKGWRIYVSMKAFNLKPCKDLNSQYHRYALFLKNKLSLSTLDTGIYDKKRVIRVIDSVNSKSKKFFNNGLLCKELSIEFLKNSSVKTIVESCRKE